MIMIIMQFRVVILNALTTRNRYEFLYSIRFTSIINKRKQQKENE